MVKVEPILNLEQIKARVKLLQTLVNELQAHDRTRAAKLLQIQQERDLLEQQLSALKTELENVRTANFESKPVQRVLN